jgi:hypothetical protein
MENCLITVRLNYWSNNKTIPCKSFCQYKYHPIIQYPFVHVPAGLTEFSCTAMLGICCTQ